MKMEIETTIRTLAISDGIPAERVDAGLLFFVVLLFEPCERERRCQERQ